jgi:hypothetical protein
MSTSTSNTTTSCSSKDSFDKAFDLSECSNVDTIAAWGASCKGEMWLQEEKKRMIRSRLTRGKSEGALDLESEEELHMFMYGPKNTQATPGKQRASFNLRRPSMSSLSVASSQTTEKKNLSQGQSSGSSFDPSKAKFSRTGSSSPHAWLLRKMKGIMQKKHRAAWLDYQSSSNQESRSFCVDSSSVDLF